MRQHWLEAPNLLSLSRIPLGLLTWAVSTPGAFLALMAVAAVTDWLDGWMARRIRRNHPDEQQGRNVEEMGAWLDPACDKVFVACLVGRLLMLEEVSVGDVLLLATRELLVVPMVLLGMLVPSVKHRRFPYRARPLGKAATVAQFACVISLWVQPEWWNALLWLAAVLGVLAGGDYARRAWLHLHTPAPT